MYNGDRHYGDFGRSDKCGPLLKEKMRDAAIGRMYNDFGRSDGGSSFKMRDAAIERIYTP